MTIEGKQKTLRFIQHYVLQHGQAPTISEIMAATGRSSKSVIHRHLQALEEDGELSVHPRRHRGIELKTERRNSTYSLPLLGRIAAGQPIEAIADEQSVNLADFLLGPNRYALRVSGDSMIEAGIMDGDTVVVKQTDTARDDEIVVALIDRESATLKRFRSQKDGTVLLIAENRNIPPMRYAAERVMIQGVVVGQLRTYR